MGFLMPALPWIVKGGAALGAALIGKKAQGSAQKRSPEEQAALAGTQRAGQGLQSTGTGLVAAGQPQLAQAGNYYSTLLRGNRAAMSQAVAGPTAQITDVYRGAERGVERAGLQGAVRDVARGELNRQRASQLSSLVTGVQPYAAEQLGSLGAGQVSAGLGAQSNAGSIFGNLLGAGYQNRVYAREEGGKAGGAVGGFLFDILSGTLGQMGKKGPPLPAHLGG